MQLSGDERAGGLAVEGAAAGAAGPTAGTAAPGTMKWYGWGAEGQRFDPVDRPGVWSYAQAHLGIAEHLPRNVPVAAEHIALPAPIENAPFLTAVTEILGAASCSQSAVDRLLHAYGKSTRDLWRMRHGQVTFAPDCVLFPETEEQIRRVIAAASLHDVVIVPFGGGSNVAGCLEVQRRDGRMVATINLRRFNRVLAIDKVSGTARIQAGILGPDLEQALAADGLTLGHFPDSFPYSTLGGWIATRSSGMLSDSYGNVEDMVLALRMLAPSGVIETRPVPHASNGPDAKRLCFGSEGTLGIITEVTLCVRRAPQRREYRGYLFPSFAAGLEAMRTCVHAGVAPALSRLNDPDRTQLSAAFRRKTGWAEAALGHAFKSYLRRVRGFDLAQGCVLIAAFEGDPRALAWRRRRAEAVYHRHGGVGLGRSPGEAFAEGKFDFPHIRDFLMDYNVLADVGETSTVWSNMLPLYRAGMAAYRDALGRGGRRHWVGCHISHSYAAGASAYFTFAFACKRGPSGEVDPWAELEHYSAAKRAGLDCFSRHGATLSHHHAVGYEHLPWLAGESPMPGGSVVAAVKATLDPTGIMNPGKLIPDRSLARLAG
jgi:alkyldihydroxyacetonephosphate synthase